MKERIRMIAILTLLALISGLLLGWANSVTRSPIELAKRAEMTAALFRVLPACDNDPLSNTNVVTEAGKAWVFYVARAGGVYAGNAFLAVADGYGGQIEVMVGLKSDDTINRVEVIAASRETPGLGLKIKDPEFLRSRFANRSATDISWCAICKDGGEVMGITGATISSRGITKAVREGLEVYARHAEKIRGTGGN